MGIRDRNISILDESKIDIDHFEAAIAVGRSIYEIQTMFGMDRKQLEDWVHEHYNGMPLQTVYDRIKMIAVSQFYEVMRDLGYRGNPSAMHIINEALNGYAEEQKTVKIVFENNVPVEDEKDKEDD